MMQFEVCTKNDNDYFFRMVDDSEEILLSTQLYKEKKSVLESIGAVKKNVPVPSGIVKQQTTEGDYFFDILNSTGMIVYRSTMFYPPLLRDKWLNDIQKEAPQ